MRVHESTAISPLLVPLWVSVSGCVEQAGEVVSEVRMWDVCGEGESG